MTLQRMVCNVACMLLLLPCLALFTQTAAGDELKPPPWHLVDIWWDLGRDAEFESYSIDVQISNEVPDDVPLYIAPIGLGHLNKTPFYGGIQTQADGHTKRDRQLQKLGRGLLMSMWNERSLDAIRPSVGGYCQSSGHEGDFVSVRRKYVWTKGNFTYRIVRMDKQIVADKPVMWVGAFLYSHERDENVFIGALRFPGEKLLLSRQIASFVEIYGPRRPPSDIPKVTVTFSNPQVNGRQVEHPTAIAIYPEGVPDYATAKSEQGKVVVQVGDMVKQRGTRRVTLLAK